MYGATGGSIGGAIQQCRRQHALFNPVVYLISGFRWRINGRADVAIEMSLAFVAGHFALCLAMVWWIFRTGYRLKA